MRCVDVNVLLYAHHQGSSHHGTVRTLLAEWANDTEPLGLAEPVLSGFLRLATNRRIFPQPLTPQQAWQAVDHLLEAPACVRLLPSERHWEIFQRLATSIGARGNDLPDAYLAAFAIDNNATWLSTDRGFARFNELRWVNPLDPA